MNDPAFLRECAREVKKGILDGSLRTGRGAIMLQERTSVTDILDPVHQKIDLVKQAMKNKASKKTAAAAAKPKKPGVLEKAKNKLNALKAKYLNKKDGLKSKVDLSTKETRLKPRPNAPARKKLELKWLRRVK